jgi:ribose-phosphate pyrophosphokinase
LVHTLKLASAKRITVVMPYYAYGRQDRKVKPRVPISASAVAQLIEAMGPSRLLTVQPALAANAAYEMPDSRAG